MKFQIMKNKTLKCELVYVTDSSSNIWFRGKSVAEILGYKDTKQALRKNIDSDDKLKLHKLVDDEMLPTLKYNQRNTIFINENGIRQLLVKSRMINAVDVAKWLGIDILNAKHVCKEMHTLKPIMTALQGQKMRTQYPVLDYRIDLYFPEYNLCIECDENGHSDRSPKEEKRRQRRITKKLKCQWIRYDPDSPAFNIFQVINQIYTVIKTHEHIEDSYDDSICMEI